LFDRGFTGHEYLDGFGLINMNGRVYDPFLARFLSPDPFVQAPDYSQNYNRYSYCLNNPLKYTDPDGEWVHLAIGAFIGGTINWIANGAEFSWKGLGYFGVGALAGAIGAGVGAGVSAAIAGAGVTGVTGASFATGFIGTSTAMSTGFCSGFVSGAAGGFSSGFISGFGNAAIQPGNNLKAMLDAGIDYGWKGAVFGGVAGGITGGIDAKLHDRNFWTGAGKQNVVFSIDEFGRSKLIDVKDFGDEPPKNILDGFKTKISTNNSTLNSDGLIHTEIKIPKSVNGVHNYLRGNYDAGVLSFSVDKGTIHITSLNPLKSAVLSGWRYHSNPLNSVKDLFHNRLFNYPWK
ncbi:MAG: RHS repeat-associated core domain-containing protein, partial [Bacteroidales bacterium]|nr:RHS repeat-associated core domain-containing protein [Bacteroidales bacterium]